MVWTWCALFKNLWLATVREPVPVRSTAVLEGRGDGSSRALLARRNEARGAKEMEEEQGRLAGTQRQTPTRATEASENQISPRSAEGGDCVGLVETKTCWTESKTGGRNSLPSRGRFVCSQSISPNRSGMFWFCALIKQSFRAQKPHMAIFLFSLRGLALPQNEPQHKTWASLQPAEGYFQSFNLTDDPQDRQIP